MTAKKPGIVCGLLYSAIFATMVAAQDTSTPADGGFHPRAKFLEPIFEDPNAVTAPALPGLGGPAETPFRRGKLLEPVFDGPKPELIPLPANMAPRSGATVVQPAAVPFTSRGCLDRFWVEADYLAWWMKGDSLPALVTSSPPGTPRGQAGVLGAPGTTVLFGNSRDNGELRSGGEITFGYWFNDCRTCGIEASFFMLESRNRNFDAASNGSTILARPFFDVTTGQQRSELIGFPGVVAARVNVADTSTGLLGAGAWFRQNLCMNPCACMPYRVDLLVGYRYLRLADNLSIEEDLISIAPNNLVPPGTTIGVMDRFSTENNFHGLDLGLAGEVHRGRWVFGWLAKVAVGVTVEELEISGSTRVSVPGLPPVNNVGGLLALQSNIGNFTRDRFAVVPEVGLRLGYQVTPKLRLQGGYNFLYWSEVARAGNQIDTSINTNLLPPIAGPVTGPLRPAANIQGTSFWAQGFSVGFVFNY